MDDVTEESAKLRSLTTTANSSTVFANSDRTENLKSVPTANPPVYGTYLMLLRSQAQNKSKRGKEERTHKRIEGIRIDSSKAARQQGSKAR